MKTILVAVLAVLAVGCAHKNRAGGEAAEPEGKPNPQVLSKLKAIGPHSPENAVVVLYRNTVFGSLFGPIAFNGTLWLNDQAAGDVRDDKYNVIELPAGRHSLRVLGTAPGIVVPLQATTVVTLAPGETKFLELNSVQEFNNVTLKFRPGASPEVIAVDCTEGFELNLAPTTAAAPSPASSRM
jgi:hypothetical protein